jgi:predicted nucleic acid-binding protein
MNRVLVDTGPLVAIFSRTDQFHDACTQALKDLAPPLYTCWPVLTEAAWLLRFDPRAIEKLLQSAAFGLYRLLSLDEEDASAIERVLRKYRRLKPRLADAALVHLASREKIDTVFTVDRRDFRVYRPAPGRAFRIVP